MSSFAAARSVLRFITARATTGPSPFRIPKQNQIPLYRFTSRSPVEMSCCVETILPYHTATGSALLTSMLSVSGRTYGWIPEGIT